MADDPVIEWLKEEGILADDAQFDGDRKKIGQALVGALKERVQLKQQAQQGQQSAKGQQNPDSTESPNSSPESGRQSPAASASAAQTPGSAAPSAPSSTDIRVARALIDSGVIQKKDGRWVADTPGEQRYAEALNQNEMQIQQTRRRADELLTTDPKAFVSEFLGDSLQDLMQQKIEEATAPLQQKLSEYEQKFVRQPAASQQWMQEHQEEFEKDDSPLKKAYSTAYQQVIDDLKGNPKLRDLSDTELDDLVHPLARQKAELELIQNHAGDGSNNGAEGESAAPQNGDPPAEISEQRQAESQAASNGQSNNGVQHHRSLVDYVNDGIEPPSSGTRNNGSSRRLNEHAQQSGDESFPTTRGEPDFMAIAAQVEREQGSSE